MLKNSKLTTKVLGAMSVLILGMLIIAGVGYSSVHKIGQTITEIVKYKIPLLNTVVEIEKDILKTELLISNLIISSKDIHSLEFKSMENKINAMEQDAQKNIKECQVSSKRAIKHAKKKKIKDKYERVLKACNNFSKEHKQFENSLKQFEHDLELGSILNLSKERKLIIKMLSKMDKEAIELVHKMENLSQYLALEAEEEEKSAVITIEVISVLVFILAIFIMLSLNRYTKNIINNFQFGLLEFFKYLNKEISTTKPLDDRYNDEIGTMAKVVNENIRKTTILIDQDAKLIEDAKATMNRVIKGSYRQTIQGSTSNQSLEEFKESVNTMINSTKDNFTQLNSILKKYASYDYMDELILSGIEKDGAFGYLIEDINKLRDAITSMLTQNKKNGLTLEYSSSILLDNVKVLNNNSNEAAASLEETAAALEEITSNISNNTNTIIKMSGFASEVTNSVKNGQELADQTTKSMDEINNEVSSINEAISVIDQIAFQTNILSLNAAVEAATAGESGKGFAVVAQEVRNLASRSAQAANEIKILVEKATLKADEGKNIAGEMIAGYAGLNDNISKTIDLISDVEMASKEQLLGIEQINNAVASLDHQTQQNAQIASQTNDVATKTDQIAKLIVSNANEKEFVGKNDIQI